MEDTAIEDTVVLFDISRSTYRMEGQQRRIQLLKNAIVHFCHSKNKVDPQDSIAVVAFGNQNQKIMEFTNNFDDVAKHINPTPSGNAEFSDALSLAIQLLAKQLQKLGDKVLRIIIITERINFTLDRKTEEVVKVSNGLNIYIDAIILAKSLDPNTKKEYAKFVKLGRGELGFFNNYNAFLKGMEGFASKKIVENIEDYIAKEKKSKHDPKILSKIAIELRRPTISEIQKILNKEVEYKCQICYAAIDPTTKQSFYITGRFCPSCGTPMHLHCSALWAKKSGISENIFRCPYCFFLLKVTSQALKQLEAQISQSQKLEDSTKEEDQGVKMVKVPDDEVEDIADACVNCSNIFTPEIKVFKCSHCGSFYHEMCLRNVYKQYKACRVCGRKIV